MVLTVSWTEMSVVKEKVPCGWYGLLSVFWGRQTLCELCTSPLRMCLLQHAAPWRWASPACPLTAFPALPSDAPAIKTREPFICFLLCGRLESTLPVGAGNDVFSPSQHSLCLCMTGNVSVQMRSVSAQGKTTGKAAKQLNLTRAPLFFPGSSSLKIYLNINYLLYV